jgi:uncharacterized membrane protein YhaH (DUF805 family)
MNWSDYLFSFKGRVSRQRYWLMMLLTLPFAIAGAFFDARQGQEPLQGSGVLFLLPIVWPALAVTIKRWHDRDKSGWWVLINLIPIIGDIWSLVENGFLKGTSGDNRFGPDPLAKENLAFPGRP